MAAITLPKMGAISGPWEPSRPWLSAGPRVEIVIFPNPDGSCQAWSTNTVEDGNTYWEGWHSPKSAEAWWQTPATSWTLMGYHQATPDGTIGKEFWPMPNGYVHHTAAGELRMYEHAILRPAGSEAIKGRPLFCAMGTKGKGHGKGKGPRLPKRGAKPSSGPPEHFLSSPNEAMPKAPPTALVAPAEVAPQAPEAVPKAALAAPVAAAEVTPQAPGALPKVAPATVPQPMTVQAKKRPLRPLTIGARVRVGTAKAAGTPQTLEAVSKATPATVPQPKTTQAKKRPLPIGSRVAVRRAKAEAAASAKPKQPHPEVEVVSDSSEDVDSPNSDVDSVPTVLAPNEPGQSLQDVEVDSDADTVLNEPGWSSHELEEP